MSELSGDRTIRASTVRQAKPSVCLVCLSEVLELLALCLRIEGASMSGVLVVSEPAEHSQQHKYGNKTEVQETYNASRKKNVCTFRPHKQKVPQEIFISF